MSTHRGLAVFGCALALACADSATEDAPHENAGVGVSLDHIPRLSPGGRWLALAKRRVDFVREFEQSGQLYLVGVPLVRLVAIAYEVHPSMVAVDPANRGDYFDAVVYPLAGESGRTCEMLRELLHDELGIRAIRTHTSVVSMVLMEAPTGAFLEPSNSRAGILELEAGRLRAEGASIAQLIELLRADSLRPVVNETRLPDRYDFLLEWDPRKGAYAFIQSLRDIGLVVEAATRELEQMVVVQAEPKPEDRPDAG